MSVPSKSSVPVNSNDFEALIDQWLDCESDVDIDNSDIVIESEHDTNSEISDSDTNSEDGDSEETTDRQVSKFYYGKNRYKWSQKSFYSRNTRTLQHNIVVNLPGLRNSYRNNSNITPLQAWSYFIDDEILFEILTWTNIEISKHREKYKIYSSDLRDVDIIELRAFIGLLFYSAVFKSNHEDISSIFATDGSGRDIFRCVTSKNRFSILLACLRFDNPDDREARKINDPAAAISGIFNKFVNNCQSVYTMGTCVCVDEMLVGFRGRCKFKMYLPLKPVKYGLKIMCLVDAKTNYFYNGYIYVGKDSDGNTLDENDRKFSKPTQSVLRLTKPINKTNRNITADNWFTSIELIEELKKRGNTYVGTVRKNKKEIPPEFLPKKNRQVGLSLFGFTKDITLVSFTPKSNKCVILASSMHHGSSIENTGKPEIIEFYNSTKGGVDSLDQKCAIYCTGRRTRRWPMAIFFRILDISGVNAYIVYKTNENFNDIARINFMKKLAHSLVVPEMERRLQNKRINKEIKSNIRRVLNIRKDLSSTPLHDHLLNPRKTCYLCPPKKKRKTSYPCYLCGQPICLECSRKVCKECIGISEEI